MLEQLGKRAGVQSALIGELGLVTIFWDLNVSAAGKAFDASGQLLDAALPRRADKMIDELLWMARVLRYGRENIPAD